MLPLVAGQGDEAIDLGDGLGGNSQIGLVFEVPMLDPSEFKNLQAAVIGLFHAGQNFEHGGFARAIAANQAHPLRGFKGKTSVVEQGDVPECQLGVK